MKPREELTRLAEEFQRSCTELALSDVRVLGKVIPKTAEYLTEVLTNIPEKDLREYLAFAQRFAQHGDTPRTREALLAAASSRYGPLAKTFYTAGLGIDGQIDAIETYLLVKKPNSRVTTPD